MTETEILKEEYGIPEPVAEDYGSDEAFCAAHDAWMEGFVGWLQQKVEKEEAARIAEEEAARKAEEEAASQQGREEEMVEPFPEYAPDIEVSVPEPDQVQDSYPVGSYVDPAGNVWSSAGELLSPGTTPAMEPEDAAGLTGELVGEPVTGDPTIDTALLLLDLMDALTGEEGMTDDVDGIQRTVDEIQQALDHPLMTTSFQDYNVTEGLLLLLLVSAFMAACAKMLKGGFSWLR